MQVIKVNLKNLQPTISPALKVLKQGGLIIYPTETCYGLGADATNPSAVAKLLQFKTRREGKAISVAVSNQQMARQYVTLNSTAQHLYRTFLPGPLTIVSHLKPQGRVRTRHSERSPSVVRPGRTKEDEAKNPLRVKGIVPGLASEKGTLGIRIPDYPLILNLVTQFGRPITATSANVSYQPQPYSLSQWQKHTPKKSRGLVDLFLNVGTLPRRSPSTVIDTTTDELTVVRQGSIKIQKPSEVVTTHSEAETRALAARIVKKHRDTIIKRGLVIALQGELGAGKTIFAQGVARALGIQENIKSPTFTLVHEYSIPTKFFTEPAIHRNTIHRVPSVGTRRGAFLRNHPTFFHLDTWRMEKEQELLDLGFEQMLRPGNLIVIEWAEKISDLLVGTRRGAYLLWVIIDILDPTTRRWQFSSP